MRIATSLALLSAMLLVPAWPASAASDDELKARAEQLIERALSRYAGLSAYQDVAEMRYDAELDADEEDSPFDMFGAMEQNARLAFAPPNRIALEAEHIELRCDGERLWIAMPMMGAYVEQPAGAAFADLKLDGMAAMFLSFMSHPVLAYLVAGPDAKSRTPELVDVSEIVPEAREGRPGQRVRAAVKAGITWGIPDDSGDSVSYSFWVDDETGLFGEFRFDITDVYNAQVDSQPAAAEEDDDEMAAFAFRMPRYSRLELIIALNDIALNEPIEDARFVYAPGPDERKVPSLEMAMDPSAIDRLRLVGSPAPEFTGPGLDDDAISLTDFRGRVVLLDFWAMWCGPCVQALPHIQTLSEQFADQPVTVLGINRDPAGSESRLTRFLEQREVTFAQVLDVDGGIAEQYRVRGIPCTVLIDKDGVVQDVSVGFMPGKEKELAEKIEKLLAGERLYDPEEIERLLAAAPDDDEPHRPRRPREAGEDDDEGDRGGRLSLSDVISNALGEAPDELVEIEGLPRQAGYGAKVVTIDGERVLVVPDPRGRGLLVYDIGGEQRERITLAAARNEPVHDFNVLDVGGEMHWVIAHMRVSRRMEQAGSVALYDRAGQRLWSFEPETPARTSVFFMSFSTGDLTGDGRPEIAVMMNVTRVDARAQYPQSNQRAVAVILNIEGDLLAWHTLGFFAHTLEIVPSAAPGEPGIVFTIGERAQRFRIQPRPIETAAGSE